MSTKKSAAEKDAEKVAEKARKAKEKKTGLRQPDPETLHTTDPQEHMKGPISSFMQKVKDKVEDNDQKDKEDPELEHQK